MAQTNEFSPEPPGTEEQIQQLQSDTLFVFELMAGPAMSLREALNDFRDGRVDSAKIGLSDAAEQIVEIQEHLRKIALRAEAMTL